MRWWLVGGRYRAGVGPKRAVNDFVAISLDCSPLHRLFGFSKAFLINKQCQISGLDVISFLKLFPLCCLLLSCLDTKVDQTFKGAAHKFFMMV